MLKLKRMNCTFMLYYVCRMVKVVEYYLLLSFNLYQCKRLVSFHYNCIITNYVYIMYMFYFIHMNSVFSTKNYGRYSRVNRFVCPSKLSKLLYKTITNQIFKYYTYLL